MNEGMISIIQQTLNEAYGESGSGPLDRVAATRILDLFQRTGWIGGQELALVVQAAGGEIRITEEQISGTIPPVLQYQDNITNEIVLKTVNTENTNERKNPTAAQRESAESRTVQSGPIRGSAIPPDA
jgi:hypothetical protein